MAGPLEKLLLKTAARNGTLYSAVSKQPEDSVSEKPSRIRPRRRPPVSHERAAGAGGKKASEGAFSFSIGALQRAVGRHTSQLVEEVPEVILAARFGVYAFFVLLAWAFYALILDPLLNPLDSQRVLEKQRVLLTELEEALALPAPWLKPLVGDHAPFTAAQRFAMFLKEAAQTTRGPPQQTMSALLLLFFLQLCVLGGQAQFAAASRSHVERSLQQQREREFFKPTAGEGSRETPSMECAECQLLIDAVSFEVAQRKAFRNAVAQLLRKLQQIDAAYSANQKRENRQPGVQFRSARNGRSRYTTEGEFGGAHQQHPCVAELATVMQLGIQDAQDALHRIESHKQRLLLLHKQREQEIRTHELERDSWLLSQQLQDVEKAILRRQSQDAGQTERKPKLPLGPHSIEELESMRAGLKEKQDALDEHTKRIATSQAETEQQKQSLQKEQQQLEQRHIAFRRVERAWRDSCLGLFRPSASWLHILLHPAPADHR